MHREIIDPTAGEASIDPSTPVIAGSTRTWRLTFTAGARGIAPGGQVRFTIPHGFSCPQSTAFFDPGFVTVEPPNGSPRLTLQVHCDIFCRLDPASGHSGAWGRSVIVHAGAPGLRAGESFTLVYGNASYYGGEPFSHAGARARELSGAAEFTIAVDLDGSRSAPYSGFARIAASPVLHVLPSRPSSTRVLAPADVMAGSEIQVHVVDVDCFNNPVTVKTEQARMPGSPCITRHATSTGAVSNPIRVHEHPPPARLFWGDIHGHTIHSDGLGSIDEYYAFARDVARLDFSAITDHDDIGPRLADDEWKSLLDAVDRHEKPGTFVTLAGHEYRNGRCDMNVYYPSTPAPLVRGTDDDWSDARKFTTTVAAHDGMIVPHMHFGADWSGFDAGTYRVLEIYSSHGSAEHRGCAREIPYLRGQLQKSSEGNTDVHAHDILNRGFRLGFTAGSDTHSGRPGLSDWTRVCRTYPGGLTAVLAPALTREAIWDALWHRRCYATTGNRTILDFTVNGSPMGSEIRAPPGEPRVIHVSCHADGELRGITVFRSGELLASRDVTGWQAVVSIEDHDRHGTDWYYARVDMAGGEMAWSSPAWVDCERGG